MMQTDYQNLVSKMSAYITTVYALEMNYKTDLCKFEEDDGVVECVSAFAGKVKDCMKWVYKLDNDIGPLYSKVEKNNPSLLETKAFSDVNKLYIEKQTILFELKKRIPESLLPNGFKWVQDYKTLR